MRQWPERWMAFSYYIFILCGTTLWPLLVYLQGSTTLARVGVCICFLGGALLSVAGYTRYRPNGRPNTLWLLQMGKAIAFSALGAGFLVLAMLGGDQRATTALMWVYAFFGWAACSILYTGAFLYLGANRGWITKEVSWWPWPWPPRR